MKSLYHSVYNLNYHLVLVTKFRCKCISKPLLEELRCIFVDLCVRWNCELLEFNGEADHVHLLVSLNPKVTPSTFVNNLKTVSSRLIRKRFRSHVDKFYSKSIFWSRSYCIVSSGGAPLEIIKHYIAQQAAPL